MTTALPDHDPLGAEMADDLPPLPGSFAAFHARLGGVPLDRILMDPPPGTATEADLIAAWEGPHQHWCELVDGTLVNRFGTFMGGVLVAAVGDYLWRAAEENRAGVVLNAKCPIRLKPDLIRCPSASFTPWDTFPRRRLPDEKVGSYMPALWVDIRTRFNTDAEQARKVSEYFAAGVKLVWVIDAEARTGAVHLAAGRSIMIDESGSLDGGPVLPGLTVPLADLFDAAVPPGRRKPRGRPEAP